MFVTKHKKQTDIYQIYTRKFPLSKKLRTHFQDLNIPIQYFSVDSRVCGTMGKIIVFHKMVKFFFSKFFGQGLIFFKNVKISKFTSDYKHKNIKKHSSCNTGALIVTHISIILRKNTINVTRSTLADENY